MLACDYCNWKDAKGNCARCEKYDNCENVKWFKIGRDDAIDEFIDKLSESIIWDILAEIMKRNIGASDGADRIIEYTQKIAEQLKEKKNDK